jgi:hypothetical protein
VPVLAAVAGDYCLVRVGCCQVARRVARRRVKTARGAAERGMCMGIAGHRESMVSGRGLMWMHDQEETATDLGGAWDPWNHRTNLRMGWERGQHDR